MDTDGNNSSTTTHVMQKCIQCSGRYDARMFTCPSCGGQETSGGVEMLEVMAVKQEAVEVGDRALEPFNHGKLEEAIAILHEAIKINPMYEQAHSNLGFVLTAKGDYQQAIDTFEHVLSFSPYREEAKRGLAVARSMLEQSI